MISEEDTRKLLAIEVKVLFNLTNRMSDGITFEKYETIKKVSEHSTGRLAALCEILELDIKQYMNH